MAAATLTRTPGWAFIVRSCRHVHNVSVVGGPIRWSERTRYLKAGPPGLAAADAGPRHGMRLLLVEDEPEAARLLAKGLREQAYAVDVAEDGRRAVFRAQTTNYDALILDVMLPHLDGLGVCRELRRAGSAVRAGWECFCGRSIRTGPSSANATSTCPT